jgi:hypothetical protein
MEGFFIVDVHRDCREWMVKKALFTSLIVDVGDWNGNMLGAYGTNEVRENVLLMDAYSCLEPYDFLSVLLFTWMCIRF